ncbi:MAG: radical SAM family heme chaperone HemW [Synechocystis sp.]|nr:radical SAM family heme chaperone HemW [Synechocystis sp.]
MSSLLPLIYSSDPLLTYPSVSSLLATAAYIHLPFCRQRCFYCDFPVTVVGQKPLTLSGWIGDYVTAICQEIQGYQPDYAPLQTIFFGGGTPSLLPIAGLTQILHTLRTQWGIGDNAEISMEIDPGTFNADQLRGYQDLGINRFSLGIQAFQDDLLAACGRHHRRQDIDLALTAIAQVGINNWSLDLISGLPTQTATHWQQSLTQAIQAQPTHLSCYDLVLEPQTVFDKREQRGQLPLPPDHLSADFYRQAQRLLTQAGFDHYEISNYAKPGYYCQHNQIYWRNQPYYGFGLGATSYLNGRRFSRPRTRDTYYQWLKTWLNDGAPCPGETVSPTETLLESLMLGLRLSAGVTWDQLPAIPGQQRQQILAVIKPFIQKQWVTAWDDRPNKPTAQPADPEHSQGFRLSDPEGFLYSNQILSTLFAALTDPEP